VSTWLGILISYDSYYWFNSGHSWPVSFCIVAVVLVVYLASGLVRPRAVRARVL
jgi:zinc/manganese transport system permease protein